MQVISLGVLLWICDRVNICNFFLPRLELFKPVEQGTKTAVLLKPHLNCGLSKNFYYFKPLNFWWAFQYMYKIKAINSHLFLIEEQLLFQLALLSFAIIVRQ